MLKLSTKVHCFQFLLCAYILFGILSCSALSGKSKASSSMFERDDTVKSAYIKIVTKEVSDVRDGIYTSLVSFSCEVESENWNNKNKITETISIGLRLPSTQFLNYIDFIDNQYEVESMQMYARKTNNKSIERNEIDAAGVVYSVIYITIDKKLGFMDSFLIGRESASEALKISLQSIIPVVLFLLPYSIIIGIIIVIVKIIKRKIIGKKKSNN